MKKKRAATTSAIVKRAEAGRNDFDHNLGLIEAARGRALAAVNTALIDLYWSIGEHISRKVAEQGWGMGTVQALAEHVQRRQPGMTGFRPGTSGG